LHIPKIPIGASPTNHIHSRTTISTSAGGGNTMATTILMSVLWTGNLLRGVPEVDECDSPRSVTRRKRHVAHNLDRFGPRGA
jgi:hypothetical protein